MKTNLDPASRSLSGQMSLASILLLVTWVNWTPLAFAQTPKSVFLEQLTWGEVRDAIAAGKTTIIVPTGGTEQNGPHMAIGKHNVRVAVNADAIARRLGNALVAPVMAYVPEGDIDPPTGHMRYPGTISLPDPVFRQVLEYTARSLKQHGFRNIVFIGDSGPNQAGQNAVAAALTAEWAGANIRVHAIEAYYSGDREGDTTEMMRRGIRKDEIGNHADVNDTSRMLAIDPKMVRLSKLQAGDGKNGVQGDPRRSTAEIGRALNERSVVRAVTLIRSATARTNTP
jgi:creatinine amidohydrolase/Fe(II)-dependent formamide hydrolase-like protein